LIQAEKANYPITVLCRVLNVSLSGFHAWSKRAVCDRTREDDRLREKVLEIHRASRGTYGSPRIQEELKARKFTVGRKRVARLMREKGITARPRRRYRRTTDSNHGLAVADNVLERNFNVSCPDTVWATDITYVRTWQGWLYLAVVIDLFSRRIVGWSMAGHMRTDLVLNALAMALGHRVPTCNLLHHSDQGSQYASDVYRKVLRDHGIICSMSRKGDCWDNAVVESFFGTLKTELVYRRPWATQLQARAAIAEYIEVFYNRQRRHSSLGYRSPVEYEDIFDTKAAQTA
jgi:transposase InsO family protein